MSQQAQGGNQWVLAVAAGTHRLSHLPSLPTTAEQGLPKVGFAARFGLLASPPTRHPMRSIVSPTPAALRCIRRRSGSRSTYWATSRSTTRPRGPPRCCATRSGRCARRLGRGAMALTARMCWTHRERSKSADTVVAAAPWTQRSLGPMVPATLSDWVSDDVNQPATLRSVAWSSPSISARVRV